MLESLVAILVGISTIITSAALGIKWLVKHYFKEIKHELKPNGGSSIKDQVNRLEKDIKSLTTQNEEGEEFHKKMDSKLDTLTQMFIDYMIKH
jgi:hypothetical protein